MSPSPLALELAQSEGAEAGGYRQEPQSQLCKPILVDNALCGVRRTVSFKPSNTGFRDAAVKCSDRLLYLDRNHGERTHRRECHRTRDWKNRQPVPG